MIKNDILHQAITFIFFPSLEDNQAQREQMSFSLNLSFIQQLEAQGSNSNKIDTARTLMRIPPDSYFRENWNQAYPLWLLKKEWSEKEVKKHFRIIDRLVWSVLRLGATYHSCIGERRASLNEALEVINGSSPVKSQHNMDYLCGEKAYASHFKHYKPVCHFIAAFEYLKSEDSQLQSLLQLTNLACIERFLSLSALFCSELLLLTTPNVKGNCFLNATELIELPEFLVLKPTHLSIEKIPGKEKDLLKLLDTI
jgi:hypothetical protein